MHRIIKGLVVVAVPVATVAVLAGSASASVSSTFIGKGDVQTAFSLTNAQIQKLVGDGTADPFTFTSQQSATQALIQAMTQDGTQSAIQDGKQVGVESAHQDATQDMLEVLSCKKTNGAANSQYRYGTRSASRLGTRSSERDAERIGTRSGSRLVSRSGTRSGNVLGNVLASIDAKARKTGQWTGWNVTKVNVTNPFAATPGTESYGAPSFSDEAWVFPASYTFGAYDFTDATWTPTTGYTWDGYTFGSQTAWSDWVADPNEDPEGVCLKPDGKIGNNVDPLSLVHTVTPGEIHDGDVESDGVAPGAVTDLGIHDGAITSGATHEGDVSTGTVSPSGPVVVFASQSGGAPRQIGQYTAI